MTNNLIKIIREAEEAIKEKYKVSDHSFSIDTVNEINEADMEEFLSHFRTSTLKLLEGVVEMIEKVLGDNAVELNEETETTEHALGRSEERQRIRKGLLPLTEAVKDIRSNQII